MILYVIFLHYLIISGNCQSLKWWFANDAKQNICIDKTSTLLLSVSTTTLRECASICISFTSPCWTATYNNITCNLYADQLDRITTAPCSHSDLIVVYSKMVNSFNYKLY